MNEVNQTEFFEHSFPINRRIKPVSDEQLKQLGLSKDSLQFAKDLKELAKTPPNIVVADCIRNIGFVQNHFKQQTLHKNKKYIMGLGIFQQLHYDMERNVKILKPSHIKFKNLYRPYRGQNLDGQTLIVSRTGGVGDLIAIQPNLIYLKEKYPTCTIKFACGPQYQSMIETWDCVDQVLDLPFTLQHFVTASYHAFFEGVVERCKEAESINFYNLFSRWLELDLPDDLLVPKQNPKEDKVNECKDIINKWGLEEKKFILMQLRASSPIRCPNPNFWISMIDGLTDRGYKILITDNPKQAEGIDRFITRLKNKDKVFNFCQYSKSLDYTIAMAYLSKLGICTDSALIHICVSVGTSIFGLYGPFPGKIRLSTYKNVDWAEAKVNCGPCFIHGHKPCPKAQEQKTIYSPCYDQLNLEECLDRIEKLYNK